MNRELGCGNAFCHVCLSVCLVRALTFKSLDLETSLLIYRYTTCSEYIGQVHI